MLSAVSRGIPYVFQNDLKFLKEFLPDYTQGVILKLLCNFFLKFTQMFRLILFFQDFIKSTWRNYSQIWLNPPKIPSELPPGALSGVPPEILFEIPQFFCNFIRISLWDFSKSFFRDLVFGLLPEPLLDSHHNCLWNFSRISYWHSSISSFWNSFQCSFRKPYSS